MRVFPVSLLRAICGDIIQRAAPAAKKRCDERGGRVRGRPNGVRMKRLLVVLYVVYAGLGLGTAPATAISVHNAEVSRDPDGTRTVSAVREAAGAGELHVGGGGHSWATDVALPAITGTADLALVVGEVAHHGGMGPGPETMLVSRQRPLPGSDAELARQVEPELSTFLLLGGGLTGLASILVFGQKRERSADAQGQSISVSPFLRGE